MGEPLGESATRAKPGGRVLGGGGGGGPVTNWPDMTTPLGNGVLSGMTGYYGVVTADTAAAAAIQASAAATYEAWQTGRDASWQAWYTSQKQADTLAQQAAMIAVKTAIDLVIADKQDKRMREIAKDQRDLADRQLKMGEELHARYVNKFAPIEDAAADFAKNDWEKNRYKPQYALQQGRAKLDAARAFGKVAGKLNKKMARYCTGANANMLRQVTTDWARMEVDMTNRAYRFEEAQMWNRDDLQWRRLQNAIANGQRLPSQAAADIANGIRTATESNAIRGQAMQGWYGALARGAAGMFRFGYGALEQQRAGQYGQLPGMARMGGMGSLGDFGLQQDILQNSYNYGEQMDTGSLTGSDATGADFFKIPDTEA
ncbi:hypothetical protein B9Z48_11535 [Limnohabitans sp. WS1]|nr:hypothetical protein B9Z48_11535 [Limnohabitans sp. WS1]